MIYFEYDVVASSLGKYLLNRTQQNEDGDIFYQPELSNISIDVNNTPIYFTSETEQNLIEHLKVESYHYGNASYNFTASSIVQAVFGFLDGSINAFPKGGYMSLCGINLRSQRYEFLNMTE